MIFSSDFIFFNFPQSFSRSLFGTDYYSFFLFIFIFSIYIFNIFF